MKHFNLLDDLEFRSDNPVAQPLLVDEHSRIIRFMLMPHQSIEEHSTPHSPFYVVVVRGQVVFSDGTGLEETVGPGTLLLFDQGEAHGLRALDEEVVFVGFLKSLSRNIPPKSAGGLLGNE